MGVHAAEMGHDNAAELPSLDGDAGFIDDFRENMALGHMEVTRILRAGKTEERKLRRSVEVTDDLDSLVPSPAHDVSVERTARSQPPTHSMTGQKVRIFAQYIDEPNRLTARGLRGKHQGVEVE
jgi:hypothetical protein